MADEKGEAKPPLSANSEHYLEGGGIWASSQIGGSWVTGNLDPRRTGWMELGLQMSSLRGLTCG